MIRVIVAGSRKFNNLQKLRHELDRLDIHNIASEIVSGGARGVDSLGEEYAKAWNIPVKVFPADWETHGKKAGYLRNQEMAQYADELFAFWDGKSLGTKHMIDLALKHNLDVEIITLHDRN